MDKVRVPVLPIEAYTSMEWFRKEQEKLFENTWQFAGFIEDLTDPGDYITVQCGRQNIVVVKDQDNSLKAFHNLCRHRGTQLLRAVGRRQKAITCPYHDWTYDLNGELISIPEETSEFEDLHKKKLCLHKASVAIWRGMLWVHTKPNTIPIDEWFSGCEKHLGPHNPERLIEYPDTRYEKVINANWKIIVENYIDVYHLAHLHSNTLNMYHHAKAEYGFVNDHFLFWEPLARKYEKNLDELIPFKRITEVNDEHLGAFVPWLFPSLGLAESESSWSTFQVIPLSPYKTKVIVRTKLEEMTEQEYFSQQEKSSKAWPRILGIRTKYETSDANDPMESGDFMEEDIYACEQLQKAMENPLFEIGATAKNMESPIIGFQERINNWLKKN